MFGQPVFVRGDVRFLGLLASVAAVLFLAALLNILGAFLMKRIYLVAALAVACLGLAGCNGLAAIAGPPRGAGQTATVLGNLQGCIRDYKGTIGGLSFTGSVEIHCEPVGPAPPTS